MDGPIRSSTGGLVFATCALTHAASLEMQLFLYNYMSHEQYKDVSGTVLRSTQISQSVGQGPFYYK